jgi:hypothetical protein
MRPQTLNQVKDRTYRVAVFETDKINTVPSLLKPYTALIEAVQKYGGEAKISYGSTVEVLINKNRTQLQAQLESEQREWDRQEELYKQVQNGEVLKSYQEYGVTEWAKGESLPEPVFNKEPEQENAEV